MQHQLSQNNLPASQSPFFHNQIVAEPFSLFAQMRSRGAVVQVSYPYERGPQKAWIVTRMKEAIQVLKDQQRFTRQWELPLPLLLGQPINMVDGSEHRRLRGLVSKMFAPSTIQKLRPRIQHIADELLAKGAEQRYMDLVHDFANPFSIHVILSFLGIPLEDWEQVGKWSAILTGGVQKNEDELASMRDFSRYIARLITAKRLHQQDDLISLLIQGNEHGERLDPFELPTMISLLIWAGSETTANFISIGTLMLLDRPERWELLRTSPDRIPSAIEEILRFNGPVPLSPPLFATEETELGGQRIQQGDAVMVALASANRDEEYFTRPDELDLARQIKRHIAFGQGIHICLGSPLARLEGNIAFATLLRRMPDLRITTPREAISWHTHFSLRGPIRLDVTW